MQVLESGQQALFGIPYVQQQLEKGFLQASSSKEAN